jgi:hypothetical protein
MSPVVDSKPNGDRFAMLKQTQLQVTKVQQSQTALDKLFMQIEE